MVSNSKILTVSYGTFSCTLEGFDDSFDTMKAIAEYFRDLAADDRYFGAEPPSPDAEMLARIAEREISRRVEAHGTNGAYHLKAGPSALTSQPAEETAPAPQQSVPEAAAAPQPEPQAAPPATAAEMPADAAFMPAPTARPASASAAAESIADKLRRIRAVAAPVGSTPPGFEEDEHAQDFLTGAPEEDALEEGDSLKAADEAEQEAELPAFEANAPETADVEQDEPEHEHEQPEQLDAAQDEQEKHELDQPQAAQDDAVAPWDEMPQAVDLDSMEDEFEPEAEIEAQPEDTQPEITAEDDAADAGDAGADDDILSRLSQADSEDDAAEDEVEGEVMAEEPAETAEAMAEIDELEAVLRAPEPEEAASSEDGAEMVMAEMSDDEISDEMSDDDDADTLSDEDDENIFGDDDDTAEGDGAVSDGQNDTLAQLLADAMTPDEADKADALAHRQAAEDDADEADSPEDDRPLAARVFKMKTADLDAALAGGDFEEDMEDASDEVSLSAEAEADLQRELAEVEAELHNARAPEASLDAVRPEAAATEEMDETAEDANQAEDEDELAALAKDDTGDEDEDHAPLAAEAEGRAKHFETPEPDAQAARIFDEADTQLEEPASNERRSAIQHLRAAVAATRAERRAGGAMQPDVDDRPYRDDLQTAVRPRRPRPMSSGATPRPSAPGPQRPAPLKLVAEQRIDTGAAPVRPRRITRADLATAPEATKRPEAEDAPGFAVFAEQMGASSLTEMLEAAAAYMADVEGMPQFSRPMLMQKLREAQDEEFSREDGLRSFGQLLRQGKLQKLKGGRFAVTEVTEFRQSA